MYIWVLGFLLAEKINPSVCILAARQRIQRSLPHSIDSWSYLWSNVQKYDMGNFKNKKLLGFKLHGILGNVMSRGAAGSVPSGHELSLRPAHPRQCATTERSVIRSVLVFKEPLLYFTVAPESERNDAGNLGVSKRSWKVLPLREKRKFFTFSRSTGRINLLPVQL